MVAVKTAPLPGLGCGAHMYVVQLGEFPAWLAICNEPHCTRTAQVMQTTQRGTDSLLRTLRARGHTRSTHTEGHIGGLAACTCRLLTAPTHLVATRVGVICQQVLVHQQVMSTGSPLLDQRQNNSHNNNNTSSQASHVRMRALERDEQTNSQRMRQSRSTQHGMSSMRTAPTARGTEW
jgi:hypothetical protein